MRLSRLRATLGNVEFDLSLLGSLVRERAEVWDGLSLAWEVGPILPNHGKAIVQATFDGPELLADITVWVSGEAELVTNRKNDGRWVNKHFDLVSAADLERALDEFSEFVRGDVIPPGAFVA